MLALKLLKKCSENSSKERGKGNSAYAYLHSRMHNAYAALYRGVEYFHRLHVTVRTGGKKHYEAADLFYYHLNCSNTGLEIIR